MRWTERQRAMLRAMGIELFERAAPGDLVDDVLVEEAPAAGSEREALATAVGAAPAPVATTLPAASIAARAAAADRTPATRAASATEAAGTSATEADWLVVGEPIDDEADSTGAQAQLLDNMLRAVGASRSAPARSGRAAFMAIADAPAAGADQRDRLKRCVATTRPRCVIAFGRGAAQALLATDEPLGALRGRRHAADGVAVVVTCSLAFLLRHPEEKARAWADLCLAVRAADGAAA